MNSKGFLLFDIDGVIRDVTNSYRLAIQKTVKSFCGWHPSIEDIDKLKNEGNWNNDWDASFELIKRFQKSNHLKSIPTKKKKIIDRFNYFYFGGEMNDNSDNWKGLIKNEKLLVKKKLFDELTISGIKWGFVSGAEPPSAKFILEEKLGLKNPPLVAMGDAIEKPNPSGFISLVSQLAQKNFELINVPIAYLGDTVADVLTVKNAKKEFPMQNIISFVVAPPHLHKSQKSSLRIIYENNLLESGADIILENTSDILNYTKEW